MKTFTVARAAKVGKCSINTINRLIAKGKLTATKHSGAYVIEADSAALLAEAIKVASPKSGYSRRRNGATKADEGVARLMHYLSLPSEKREILIKLGERFDVDNLKLLLEL